MKTFNSRVTPWILLLVAILLFLIFLNPAEARVRGGGGFRGGSSSRSYSAPKAPAYKPPVQHKAPKQVQPKQNQVQEKKAPVVNPEKKNTVSNNTNKAPVSKAVDDSAPVQTSSWNPFAPNFWMWMWIFNSGSNHVNGSNNEFSPTPTVIKKK